MGQRTGLFAYMNGYREDETRIDAFIRRSVWLVTFPLKLPVIFFCSTLLIWLGIFRFILTGSDLDGPLGDAFDDWISEFLSWPL